MSTTTTLLGTQFTALNTELDSLANNAAVLGAELTNANAGYLFCDVEYYVTGAVAFTAGTALNLWFLVAEDGTNYEEGSASITPARPPDVVLPVRAVNTQIHETIRDVPLPGQTKFKVLAQNNATGQALAGAGVNFVKITPKTLQAT